MRTLDDLREMITLSSKEVTTANGSSTSVPVTVGSYHASVYGGSDREYAQHGVTWTHRPIVATMRAPLDKTLTAGLILTWRGEDYRVVSVQPAERRGWLKLRAERVAPEEVGVQ